MAVPLMPSRMMMLLLQCKKVSGMGERSPDMARDETRVTTQVIYEQGIYGSWEADSGLENPGMPNSVFGLDHVTGRTQLPQGSVVVNRDGLYWHGIRTSLKLKNRLMKLGFQLLGTWLMNQHPQPN